MPEIEAGNVVRLKSGGPAMMVIDTFMGGNPPFIEVMWFDEQKHLKCEKVPAACVIVEV